MYMFIYISSSISDTFGQIQIFQKNRVMLLLSGVCEMHISHNRRCRFEILIMTFCSADNLLRSMTYAFAAI